MFIWRVDTIAGAFRKYAPELSARLEGWQNGRDYNVDFSGCEKISIDYAIMEKAGNVVVGEAPFDWNDIGSWSALRSFLPLDEAGNAIRGNVLAQESVNNVLDDTLLGVIGMRDIAVIKSGNEILVCPLSKEQEVKKLVKEISERKGIFI